MMSREFSRHLPRTLTYNSLSQLLSANGINFATAALYAPHGALAGVKYGVTGSFTGVVTTNSYNSRLQPVLLSAASPSQTALSLSYDFHLGNGNNGNVFQIINNRDAFRPLVGSVTYSYDALNRIQGVGSAGTDCTVVNGFTKDWGESFTIDSWGNLTDITPTKCSAENLHAGPANTKNQLSGYCHDAAGNLTGIAPCPASSYIYDAENRLKTAAGVNYTYDGDGKRVKKDSGKLCWTGTGSDPLDESDLSGNVNEEYIFVAGKRVARLDLPSGAVHYYFSDHLGSASVIANADGSTIEQESDYYPYGSERVITAGANTYKFTGKERDTESGLDNFGARYYGSNLGRFMQIDPLLSSGFPINPQTWNRYAYALNNPLRIVDSTGLYDWDTSAGGFLSDYDLAVLAKGKDKKRRKWAQDALAFREAFREALDNADEAAGSSTLSEEQQSAAQEAVDSYGTEGDGQGPTVGFQGGYGATTVLNDDDTISVKIGFSLSGDSLTATVAHEGVHVVQANTWLDGGESSIGNLDHYARDRAAWAVGSSIAQALGMKNYGPHGGDKDLQVWNKGWKKADIETLRAKGIGNILNLMKDQSSDAEMRKTYSDEHHHD